MAGSGIILYFSAVRDPNSDVALRLVALTPTEADQASVMFFTREELDGAGIMKDHAGGCVVIVRHRLFGRAHVLAELRREVLSIGLWDVDTTADEFLTGPGPHIEGMDDATFERIQKYVDKMGQHALYNRSDNGFWIDPVDGGSWSVEDMSVLTHDEYSVVLDLQIRVVKCLVDKVYLLEGLVKINVTLYMDAIEEG